MSKRALGSIQWRRDGVARVELQAGVDPITGTPRRMSRTVKGTEADAERALAQMLLEVGRLPAGGKLTVKEYLLDLYLPRVRRRRETVTGYRTKIENHVIPKLGDIQLNELEPWVLEDWLAEIEQSMSARSALNVYRVLCTALNRAVKWKRLQANPLLAVDAPKPEERDVNTLSAKDVVAYLEAFRDHRLEPLVIVAVYTGLRPCELCALSWSDIDFTAGEVRVRRGLHEEKSETWFEPTKSQRSKRDVTLDAGALARLKELRQIGPLVAGDGVENHARPTTIAREYRRHVKASELRYVPIRDLRHSHATLSLEAGVDVTIVSRRLGHSTVAITDAYYLRPKRSADKQAADAFGNLLGASGREDVAGVSGRDV